MAPASSDIFGVKAAVSRPISIEYVAHVSKASSAGGIREEQNNV